MNSEKMKEIKKALVCMSGLCKDSLTAICFDCEVDKKFDEESACKEALTLINELESENERLNKSDTSKEESSIEYYNLYKDLKRKNKDLNELCELQRVNIAENFVKENQLKDQIVKLESENERLQKDCADIANDYQEMGTFYYEECEKNQQLKDRIAKLKSENKKLKQHKRELQGGQQDLIKQIAELEKRCHFIWALGYDYDGYEKAESLKSLIDELVAISQGNWGNVCSKYENK